MGLPRFIAVKSKYTNKYLTAAPITATTGLLQFSADHPAAYPSTIFEVHAVQNNPYYSVHLRCCFNGKYLARPHSGSEWIYATSDRPEESPLHWACTLFWPIPFVGAAANVFYFVQMFNYLSCGTWYQQFFPAFGTGTQDKTEQMRFLFEVVDWEAMMLPSRLPLTVVPSGGRRPPPPSLLATGVSPDIHETLASVSYGGKREEYEEEFTIISSPNDFWGVIFASTDILPRAYEDVYTSIEIQKGDGFTDNSIRKLNFIRGKQPQWENWIEEIVKVDHEKKTVTWSTVKGGPLNQCDSYKYTVTVAPTIAGNEKGHGCVAKWTCRVMEPRGFDANGMKKFVKATFGKLDMFLQTMEFRERLRTLRVPGLHEQ